jgi:hypothetical protein
MQPPCTKKGNSAIAIPFLADIYRYNYFMLAFIASILAKCPFTVGNNLVAKVIKSESLQFFDASSSRVYFLVPVYHGINVRGVEIFAGFFSDKFGQPFSDAPHPVLRAG